MSARSRRPAAPASPVNRDPYDAIDQSIDAAKGTTHRHINRPTDAQLAELVEDRPPPVREAYLVAHRLILESVPEVAYTVDCADGAIGYGARQFGYDGWGMVALTPHASWVSLGFTRGASLEDPERALQGTGRSVRHLKLRSADEVVGRREAIRRLLRAAAAIT